VGDLSFVYDSNALWNKSFPANLKIVVINDGGGGIFRLLDGPDRMDFFEDFSVTHHPVSLELLSQSFGREFRRAEDIDTLIRDLHALFDPGSSLAVVEVDTTKSENSRIFKEFFNQDP
jgi:2-succinyl-5-enolpyruvyl-6-hydroxy-3-cyclohexene-1-carboxylate synthase